MSGRVSRDIRSTFFLFFLRAYHFSPREYSRETRENNHIIVASKRAATRLARNAILDI
jgi:hypothetical protein